MSCFVFGSLVMQWRFVNRIQKQMTAFKEVTVSVLESRERNKKMKDKKRKDV